MKKSELVYKLIESLDKSEKRSFNIYLSKYSKASNAQVLFDTICKLKQGGTTRKKDAVLKEMGIKNLAYEKHRLKTLLIEFLGDYYKNNSIVTRILTLFIQINVLLDKGQYELIKELIEEGIELAQQMESSSFLFGFGDLKLSLAKKQYNLPSKEFYDLLEFNTQCVEDLSKKLEYKNLQEKMYFWFLFDYTADAKEAESSLELIAKHPLFASGEEPDSISERKYFLRTKILYYRAIRQTEKVIEYERRLIDLYEKNKAFTKMHLSEYISNYYNSVSSHLTMGNVKEAKKVLKKGEKIPKRFEDYFDKRISETYYSFSMIMHLCVLEEEGKSAEAMSYIKEHKEALEYHFSKSPTFKADYLHLANSQSFLLGNYKESIQWCNRCEKELDINDKRKRTYWSAKAIAIICCHELGDIQQMNSHINAYYYHQRKHNVIMEDYYKGLMKFFRKLQQEPNEKELLRACMKLKELCKTEIKYYGKDLLEKWLNDKLVNQSRASS